MEMVQEAWSRLSSNPLLPWVLMFGILSLISSNVAFFRARKIQPGVFRWDQAVKEVILINISGILGLFFLSAFTHWLTESGWSVYNTGPTHWWNVALEFALFFVLFDTWFYWNHRLMHIEPIYTIVHRWHHLSLTPTIVSTLNVNPLESLINGGFLPSYVAIAYLIGMPIHEASAPWMGGATFFIGLWIHCGFEFLPRWWNQTWATKWFITATFHDQHHQYFRYNYGGFTTMWDRICGTMRPKYEEEFANPRARVLEEKRKAEKVKKAQQGGEGSGGGEAKAGASG